MITVISALVGIAFGLRFKILILVPAITLVAILAIMVEIGRGDGFLFVALRTLMTVAAFQLGYLAGIMIHAVIEEIFPGNGDSDQNLKMQLARSV
jgi:hypothetical protein